MAQLSNKIRVYLDREVDFDKDVLYYKNKIAKMGGKDIKLNKIQKKNALLV